MEAIYETVHIPNWLTWAAPVLGGLVASLMAFAVIMQRAQARLRFATATPAGAFLNALPKVPDPAVRCLAETRTDVPARRTVVAIPVRPPGRLAPVPAFVRRRGHSSIFRRRERRQALRRGGDPYPVMIRHLGSDLAVLPGDVLDRSRTGMCLAVEGPLAAETVVEVRASIYGDEGVWVPVRVRHCRQRGKKWILGCQFTSEQPWSVLLLFG